jgi:predicted dehydrogenase
MTIKIGLIGCGSIARQHYVGFESVNDRVQLTALADVDVENRAWFADRVPGAEQFDDFHDMWPDVDAVDICLPHHLHHDAIMSAIRAGKHWICEKPLCMTLEEAADIDAAMNKTDLIGMSAHNQVFLPTLCEARRLLDAGLLGRVYSILTQDCFLVGLPAAGSIPGTQPPKSIHPDSWRAKKQFMGGGELIDTGYHPSYMLLFLAQAKPQTVAAVAGRYRIDALEGEDTANVLVKFDNGVTGQIRTSWAMELPAGHYNFHVIGEHGQIYGNETTLFHRPNRFDEPARWTFPEVHTYQAEIVHFVECLETGSPPIQSYKDGIRVLELIKKAYAWIDDSNAGVT